MFGKDVLKMENDNLKTKNFQLVYKLDKARKQILHLENRSNLRQKAINKKFGEDYLVLAHLAYKPENNEWYINDSNHIHSGTISYFDDLYRKLFSKSDLKIFLSYLLDSNHLGKYAPFAQYKIHSDTMTLNKAKSLGLIKTNQYNRFKPQLCDSDFSYGTCSPGGIYPY